MQIYREISGTTGSAADPKVKSVEFLNFLGGEVENKAHIAPESLRPLWQPGPIVCCWLRICTFLFHFVQIVL